MKKVLYLVILSAFLLMSAGKKVAVVTGANKGIGLEVARQLCKENVQTILACRSEILGTAAAKELRAEGLDAVFEKCDIGSEDSIKSFVAAISSKYSHIDILLNNAAIAYKNSDPTPFNQQARPTMAINYFGTLQMTEAMLPLLKASPSPRIVNVASQAGTS